MDAVTLVAKAIRQGGRVIWTDSARPRLEVPEAFAVPLQQHAATLRAILARAALLRGQAATPGPVPILTLPGIDAGLDECLTCGDAVAYGLFRCPTCQVAVALALGISPPEDPCALPRLLRRER
jgi:hypothetical protein